jgi:hypothetical protein
MPARREGEGGGRWRGVTIEKGLDNFCQKLKLRVCAPAKPIFADGKMNKKIKIVCKIIVFVLYELSVMTSLISYEHLHNFICPLELMEKSFIKHKSCLMFADDA